MFNACPRNIMFLCQKFEFIVEVDGISSAVQSNNTTVAMSAAQVKYIMTEIF